MFTSTCVFVDGQHAWAGPNCPHTLDSDETGLVVDTGWTAQSTS